MRIYRGCTVEMLSAAEDTATRHVDVHANVDVSTPNNSIAKPQNDSVVQGSGGSMAAPSASLDMLKNAVQTSDPDALTKLLEHIESLKHSNAEMSETLEGIQKKNMEKYHVEVQEKIQPWVTSLNIPDDQKASFLQGIQLACEQGMKKRGMLDFQSNPAFSIACAAAEAHGTAIQSAEAFRVQLLEANNKVERIKEEESTNYNNNRNRQHAILSSALTDDSHAQNESSKKRKSDEMYNTPNAAMDPADQPATTCWTTVFNKMLPGADTHKATAGGSGHTGYAYRP